MQYNIKNIITLLTETFNDEELNIFCQENFYEIYNNFAIGQSKNMKISALIDFANRKGKMDSLLEKVKEANEFQYKKYLPYINRNEETGTNNKPETNHFSNHIESDEETTTNNEQEIINLTNMTRQELKNHYLEKFKTGLVSNLNENSKIEEWEKEKKAVEIALAKCHSKKKIVYYSTCPVGLPKPASYDDYTKILTEYPSGKNSFESPVFLTDNFSYHQFTDKIHDLKIQEIEILHICMHGKKVEGNYFLIFKDGNNAKEISVDGFTKFIRKITVDYGIKIHCLLLSACHSFKFAEAVSKYIPFVIGMNNKVQVTEAPKFTEGFYQKIFRKSDICDAFCNGAIPSLGGNPDGTIFPKDIPVLYKNGELLKNNKLCQK